MYSRKLYIPMVLGRMGTSSSRQDERLAKIHYINSSDVWFWPINTSVQNVRDVRCERSNLLRKATVAWKVKMDMILVYQEFQV